MVYLLVSWLFRVMSYGSVTSFLAAQLCHVAVTRLLAVQSDVIYGSISSFLAAQ